MANPRYVFLLGRLRNRQITMEEATELFTIQQQLLAAAVARNRSAPVVGARAPGGPSAGGAPGLTLDEDGFALGLLALGAGAGVLAAILKRAQSGSESSKA